MHIKVSHEYGGFSGQFAVKKMLKNSFNAGHLMKNYITKENFAQISLLILLGKVITQRK